MQKRRVKTFPANRNGRTSRRSEWYIQTC